FRSHFFYLSSSFFIPSKLAKHGSEKYSVEPSEDTRPKEVLVSSTLGSVDVKVAGAGASTISMATNADGAISMDSTDSTMTNATQLGQHHRSGSGGSGTGVSSIQQQQQQQQVALPSSSTTSEPVNLDPYRALKEGKDPTLAELIQALPPNWTDSKLRMHSGAVELSALSDHHPAEILFHIKKVVLRLGLEIRTSSGFKIKCVRRKRRSPGSVISNGAGQGAAVGHSSGIATSQTGGAGVGSGSTGLNVANSVRGMFGGHRHGSSSGVTGTPDDTASVMSSNLSVDREAWISARGGGAGTQQPGATSTPHTITKKKNGFRTLLFNNGTSLSLSSSSSPSSAQLPSVHKFLNSAMSGSGSIPNNRPLTQTMNGSSQGLGSPVLYSGHASASTTAVEQTIAGLSVSDISTHGMPAESKGKQVVHDEITPMAGALNLNNNNGSSYSPQQPPPHLQPHSNQHQPLASSIAEYGTLYGEDSFDSGDEIRFSIELCRIKNLHGLYSVDIRRVKGNLWAYKFLYYALLKEMDFEGQGGYTSGGMQSLQQQQQQQQQQPPSPQLQAQSHSYFS
ncbi:hypothetical protein BGW38_003314, partial [Lunasporangiospora selenospora]